MHIKATLKVQIEVHIIIVAPEMRPPLVLVL